MTEKVERLVNLTIALLETPGALTLEQIRGRTRYYAEGDRRSARRMFERDKDELRRLGVPIETVTLAHGEEQAYTIGRRAYELPDVELSAEEVAALALAVRLAGGDDTALALAKLAARAPDPAQLEAGARTRVEVSPEPIDAVADAVVERRVLSFGYRAADGTAGRRRVDPYGVVQRRGAWYLVGRDHARDAVRAFRLDRMTDRPTPEGPPAAFLPPDDLDVAAAVAPPAQAGVEVTLAVDAAARWAVEVRGARDTGRTHHGRAVLTLDELHPVRDRAWVLGLGPGVEVLGPPELCTAVREALVAVLRAHAVGDQPAGGPAAGGQEAGGQEVGR